jgi:hypothetical protein
MLAITQARIGSAHKREDDAFENGTIGYAAEKRKEKNGWRWTHARGVCCSVALGRTCELKKTYVAGNTASRANCFVGGFDLEDMTVRLLELSHMTAPASSLQKHQEVQLDLAEK